MFYLVKRLAFSFPGSIVLTYLALHYVHDYTHGVEHQHRLEKFHMVMLLITALIPEILMQKTHGHGVGLTKIMFWNSNNRYGMPIPLIYYFAIVTFTCLQFIMRGSQMLSGPDAQDIRCLGITYLVITLIWYSRWYAVLYLQTYYALEDDVRRVLKIQGKNKSQIDFEIECLREQGKIV